MQLTKYVLALSAISLAACTQETTAPRSPQHAALSSVVKSLTAIPTPDDEMDAINTDVAGFGGYFVGKDGGVYVYHTNPSEPGLAVLLREKLPQALSGRPLHILAGQFSFHDLRRWKDGGVDVLNDAGAAFIDADESRNRVTIGVSDPSAEDRIRAHAISFGIPAEAIAFQVVDRPTVHSTLLDDNLGTERSGVRVGIVDYHHSTGASCTLGMVAEGTSNSTYNFYQPFNNDLIDADLWVDKYYLITNSHCSGEDSATMGTTNDSTLMYQTTYPYRIGKKYYDAPFQYTGIYGCPTNHKCRGSDAAVYTLDGNYCPFGSCGTTYSGMGTAYRTVGPWSSSSQTTPTIDGSNPTWSIVPVATSDTYKSVANGDSVYLIGSSSGTTVGVVTNTCVTSAQFNSSTGLDMGTAIVCNFVTNAAGKGGDSGAGVFVRAGSGSLYTAGLEWGGGTSTTYFAGWGSVAWDLQRVGHRLRGFAYTY